MNTRTILIGALVVAGLYLLINHNEHVVPYLPFTFFLGCLFMHMFMHGNHAGNEGNTHHDHMKRDEHDHLIVPGKETI